MKNNDLFNTAGVVTPSVVTWASLYLSRYVKGVELPRGYLLEEVWYWDCVFVIAIGFIMAVGAAIRSSSEGSKVLAGCMACGLFAAFLVVAFTPPSSFTVTCTFIPSGVPVPLKTPLARPKVVFWKGALSCASVMPSLGCELSGAVFVGLAEKVGDNQAEVPTRKAPPKQRAQ